MRAINHAMTGAVIGLTLTAPAIALPASFISHFICDMIPHYGGDRLEGRLFKFILMADALLCGLLVLVLGIIRPEHWLLAAVCAFVAASPDFFWLNKFIYALRKKPWKAGVFTRFAANIQWFEKPIGAVVDAAWFLGGVVLLSALM